VRTLLQGFLCERFKASLWPQVILFPLLLRGSGALARIFLPWSVCPQAQRAPYLLSFFSRLNFSRFSQFLSFFSPLALSMFSSQHGRLCRGPLVISFFSPTPGSLVAATGWMSFAEKRDLVSGVPVSEGLDSSSERPLLSLFFLPGRGRLCLPCATLFRTFLLAFSPTFAGQAILRVLYPSRSDTQFIFFPPHEGPSRSGSYFAVFFKPVLSEVPVVEILSFSLFQTLGFQGWRLAPFRWDSSQYFGQH